jgi:hypothetical protein
MKTAEKVITVTARCAEGHEQTLNVDAAMGLEWVKGWVGLMDGTSPFYVHPPIGTDSMIGKCGICGSQIKCTVEDVVDRTACELVSGAPVTGDDHKEIQPSGMQKDYVVLTADERAKGFVRPVRRTYIHVGHDAEFYNNSHVLVRAGKMNSGRRACGGRTTMALPIAETYARDPQFYTGTFCTGCGAHLPLDEFIWEGTREQVGS